MKSLTSAELVTLDALIDAGLVVCCIAADATVPSVQVYPGTTTGEILAACREAGAEYLDTPTRRPYEHARVDAIFPNGAGLRVWC